MRLPLQVFFRGMDPTPALEADIRRRAQALDRFAADLMACRVEVAMLHKHRHQGQPFAVRLHVTLSGHELTVDHVQHEDLRVALRDAFADVRRQIEDTVRRRRGEVKAHSLPAMPPPPGLDLPLFTEPVSNPQKDLS
jgi:ribosome-associated translation inhibitor RaiA